MGNSTYSSSSRSLKASKLNYDKVVTDYATFNAVFENQKKRCADDLMNPLTIFKEKKTINRESRFSEAHPAVIPILFGLDQTGSMGDIPKRLVAGALPKLMTTILDSGYDVALMFCPIGDHKSDHYSFQISQFESGDEELDMWLTKSYLEGNGGGNGGESYHILWYFALNHVSTDFRDKLNKKPLILTVGDEPVHKNLPSSYTSAYLNSNLYPEGVETSKLFEDVSKLFEVKHIHLGHKNDYVVKGWKELIGEDNVVVADRNSDDSLIQAILNIISSTYSPNIKSSESPKEEKNNSDTKEENKPSQSLFDKLFG